MHTMSNNFCFKKNNRSGRTIQWAIAFTLLVAFALSLASVLDCEFVQVNIGFVPINFNENFFQDTASISIGLWSTPNPNPDESQCLSPMDSRDVVGLTKSDSFYQEILYNGDDLWSLARIIALISLIIAFVDMVGSVQATIVKVIILYSDKTFLSYDFSKSTIIGNMDSDLYLYTLVKRTPLRVLRYDFCFNLRRREVWCFSQHHTLFL
jgi:hypothetical protein